MKKLLDPKYLIFPATVALALLGMLVCSTLVAMLTGIYNPLAGFSAKQALKDVKDELDLVPFPADTTLVSEQAAIWCCGNGNHPEADLIVTKLYNSRLSKEEIKGFYENLPQAQSVMLVFVDEAIEENPDRKVYLPCFPYNLFDGHNIPEVPPTDEVLFIIYRWSWHVHPDYMYCD